ncbi:MAG: 4Fe-4S dicluster domain-containing protein [Bacillota bacterium]|nr:4Fe-4S dicluster domain-containing protein [Bacillota bacterium]
MRIFDTSVQELKYKVLMELAYQTWRGNDAFTVFNEIANEIVKKGEPTMSCCIYKDRAIVAERIRIALGGNKDNPNVIQVIDIACDECPVAGHVVTDLCRGCVAHRCADVCKVGAITFDHDQMAHIDKSKCVECGRCAKVCPYSAITNFKRPCEKGCKVDAIHMAKDGVATIDSDKCIACGTCVYQCPFGATLDVSSITHIIKTIMASEENSKYKVYAIVAPSIAGQFTYAKPGQVIAAIKELGFYAVEEVALGADMVAYHEAKELQERGFMTSSCCPAFVKYIKTKFPDMEKHISSSLSPMAETGKLIKERDPDAKVVFIGPCTSKKAEVRLPEVSKYVDYVMTFEELQAMIDSKDIIVDELPEMDLHNASYYGRIFARVGGVSEAVTEAVKEQGAEDFEFNPMVCDGIDKCKNALLRAGKGALPNNFIEGMVCTDGCIGGAACLNHGEANKKEIDHYGKHSNIKDIKTAVDLAAGK